MELLRLTDVGKRYRLHARRDLLGRRLLDRLRRGRTGDFWALRGVGFAVETGETLALVGRNGAGKSTLMSLIAGVARPTEGRIERHGRISALLELGTGFHPDLTGLENIVVNASLLGMHRRDAASKLDSIVDFAELGDFIDEPLRAYSSGMVARLAFAVAIHVDPEILVLDEVMAVGDAKFQAKCRGRVEELARGGAALLFVSHNPAAVRSLCKRAIWLENGRVLLDGPSAEVVEQYEASIAERRARPAAVDGR